MGIRVLNSTSDLSSKLLAPTFLRALRAPLVVTPYLREPLLHNGRKWDVRTYVLATSVLPMRLYMFSEAIVRYAAASTYSPTSTDDGSVLTNTWVGQRLLQRGVSSITGSLANLCRLPTPHDADGRPAPLLCQFAAHTMPPSPYTVLASSSPVTAYPVRSPDPAAHVRLQPLNVKSLPSAAHDTSASPA